MASPASLPADALPGRVGEVVRIHASSLSGDADDPDELLSLLEASGFSGGIERTFSQTQGRRRQGSVARVLAFGDAEGAEAYVAWLRAHVDEVIGSAELLGGPGPGIAGFLALSEPGDCCPKATDVYLAAWARGPTVLTLEVGGDGVEPDDVEELVAMLDGAVG